MFKLSEPHTPLQAHYTYQPKTKVSRDERGRDSHFATGQIAWSPDGEWMVGVGDRGVMCLFHRDASSVIGDEGVKA